MAFFCGSQFVLLLSITVGGALADVVNGDGVKTCVASVHPVTVRVALISG
jgi:hypothetical protein